MWSCASLFSPPKMQNLSSLSFACFALAFIGVVCRLDIGGVCVAVGGPMFST